jgi:N,N'-diacetyllegionaminate synthase
MNKLKIVAEIACAHEGDMNMLLEMIKVAGEAKVDVLQFQFFEPTETTLDGSEIRELACSLYTPLDFYEKLFIESRRLGVEIWINPADVVSAKASEPFKPDLWRIHSSDINNLELITFLCTTGVPISFAVGGSTPAEIDYAIEKVTSLGGTVDLLVHGFQGYPTPITEANLKAISELKERYQVNIGYQDHTDGYDPLGFILPAMALALGAMVIEKHYTLDRDKRGIDYHASLNPDELIKFTKQIREVSLSLGEGISREFGEMEGKYRKNFKKGFVFKTDLERGHKISAVDLKMVRTNDLEIYGVDIDSVLGRELKISVKKDEIVRRRNISE